MSLLTQQAHAFRSNPEECYASTAVIARSVNDEESLSQFPLLPACIPNCRFITAFGMTRKEGGSE